MSLQFSSWQQITLNLLKGRDQASGGRKYRDITMRVTMDLNHFDFILMEITPQMFLIIRRLVIFPQIFPIGIIIKTKWNRCEQTGTRAIMTTRLQ